MKKVKNESIKNVLRKLYKILTKKQKISFLVIVLIMIISTGLTQITPKAIGWLTDDIITQSEIAFSKVIPFFTNDVSNTNLNIYSIQTNK